MRNKLAPAESFSFSGEEFGAVGAATLRKVKTLAEAAPAGRLFASISTLTEMSSWATSSLEQGDLPRATHIAKKLAASGEGSIPEILKAPRKRA